MTAARRLAAALALAIAASVLASPACSSPIGAGTAVTLRAETASPGEIVTLGDLFDGAGAAAPVPVARRTGASVILNARAVQVAAARAGLDWDNAQGLQTIVVRGDGAPRTSPPSTGTSGAEARTAAAARGNVQVLTYARSLMAGEVIQPQDLVWAKAAAQPGDAPQQPEAAIGMAAKRPVREGAAVSLHDLATVQVVKTGEAVTVTYAADGVTLSLDGKAMNAGGVGETINIQNTASKKTIQAVVTGPGRAVVGPAAEGLKAEGLSRYALR